MWDATVKPAVVVTLQGQSPPAFAIRVVAVVPIAMTTRKRMDPRAAELARTRPSVALERMAPCSCCAACIACFQQQRRVAISAVTLAETILAATNVSAIVWISAANRNREATTTARAIAIASAEDVRVGVEVMVAVETVVAEMMVVVSAMVVVQMAVVGVGMVAATVTATAIVVEAVTVSNHSFKLFLVEFLLRCLESRIRPCE